MTKIPRNPNNSSNSSMHIGYLPQFNRIQELKRLIWKTRMDLNEGGSNAYVALVVTLGKPWTLIFGMQNKFKSFEG